MSDTVCLSEDGEGFLFQEKEFEAESFDPAVFVAKYRRVSSLESIRDQLVSYSKSVKNKLYGIINRDYKDFITISTKLDGLDTRLEMVEKPLFALQMDLSALHDGVASSLLAIQGKLEAQRRIARQKALLQSVVQCMDELAVAQSALQLSHTHTETPSLAQSSHSHNIISNRRLRLYRLAQAMGEREKEKESSLSTTQATDDPRSSVKALEKDLFVCSEYERAAVSLSSALERLPYMLTELNNSQGEEPALAHTQTQTKALRETVCALRERVESAVESLTHKIRAHLDHAFSLAASTQLPLTTDTQSITDTHTTQEHTEELALSQSCTHTHTRERERERALELRAFAHCLRALACVRRAHVAEESLTGLVEPFLRQQFTQGKVDGPSGRNSFSGLALCLDTLAQWISHTKLRLLLYTAESLMQGAQDQESDNNTVDLLLRGIVLPLSKYLHEKMPSLFSISRTEVFSCAFRGVSDFLASLPEIVSLSERDVLCEETRTRVHKRVFRSDVVRAFVRAFKTEVYLSLRSRESATRVDRRCVEALCEHHALTAHTQQASEERESARESEREQEVSKRLSLSLSFAHSLYACVCAESLLALHKEVALAPRALAHSLLSQRLVLRLLLHVSLCASLHATLSQQSALSQVSPSLAVAAPDLGVWGSGGASSGSVAGILCGTLSRSDFDALRAQYLSQTLSQTQSQSPHTTSTVTASSAVSLEPKTPSKSPNPQAAVPSTPSQNTLSQAPTLSAEELLTHSQDTLSLAVFVRTHLREASLSALKRARVLSPSPHNMRTQALTESESRTDEGRELTALTQSLVSLESVCVYTARALMLTLSHTLYTDCKRTLAQVKSVAGKYRMTNKPAPQTHSSYVDQLFAPVRSILTGPHASLLHQVCLSLQTTQSVWLNELVSAVTHALCEQIQSLCETVRQMESALQRRSAASQRTRATAGVSEGAAMSDAEKITLQLRLDVAAVGKEIDALGCESASCGAYQQLKALDLNCSS